MLSRLSVASQNLSYRHFTVPLQGPTVRPQLMTGSGMLAQTAQRAGPSPISPGQQLTAAQADASTAASSGTTTVVTVGGQTINIFVSLQPLRHVYLWVFPTMPAWPCKSQRLHEASTHAHSWLVQYSSHMACTHVSGKAVIFG